MDTSGFYTNKMRYAANAVYGPGYILKRQDKDSYTYPVGGWTWYDSRELALQNAVDQPSNTEQEAEILRLEYMVQEHLDSAAFEKGYDHILSAVTYANSKDAKFGREGQAFLDWRTDVWKKCYEIMNDVMSGKITKPTDQQLLNMLPKLKLI